MRKWPTLDGEDCISEASVIFIQAMNTFPLDSGHFLDDYCEALMAHMKTVKQSIRLLCRTSMWSLDAPIQKHNGEPGWTLLDQIATEQ